MKLQAINLLRIAMLPSASLAVAGCADVPTHVGFGLDLALLAAVDNVAGGLVVEEAVPVLGEGAHLRERSGRLVTAG
jgi:hypothetical protein